jgi:hypothetical protein
LVKDAEISKQFGASMSSFSGAGTTTHSTSVTPTLNTDNFYALGTFTLSFDGKYCVKGDKIDLDGTFHTIVSMPLLELNQSELSLLIEDVDGDGDGGREDLTIIIDLSGLDWSSSRNWVNQGASTP